MAPHDQNPQSHRNTVLAHWVPSRRHANFPRPTRIFGNFSLSREAWIFWVFITHSLLNSSRLFLSFMHFIEPFWSSGWKKKFEEQELFEWRAFNEGLGRHCSVGPSCYARSGSSMRQLRRDHSGGRSKNGNKGANADRRRGYVADIKIPVDAADKAFRTGKVEVGWLVCSLCVSQQSKICSRYQQFEHRTQNCWESDWLKLCRRCGDDGHKAQECKNTPNYIICENEEHRDHLTGVHKYPAFKQAGK